MSTRVGIVADFAEEHWPSMDLVAEMLAAHLPDAAPDVTATLLRPPFSRRAMRLPIAGRMPAAYALDRYTNRYADYTCWLWHRRRAFDVFHVIDHSYAHLVHVLPGERTIVTCHDVEAFRAATGGEGNPLYRPIARRILSGLRQAALVTCDTYATRDEVVGLDLLSADRLVVVPNGVHPAMFGDGDGASAQAEVERMLGPAIGPELLHVGSTVARKRIDLLLEAFARIRLEHPDIRLVRVGGPLTTAQRTLARRLGVGHAILELPNLAPDGLAAVYRRATLTLLPSDREGFGLPLVESLAARTPVLASRIPSLVEIGGGIVAYAEPGNAASWSEGVSKLLAERAHEPGWWSHRREEGRRQARRFCWARHASAMADLYRRIGQPCRHSSAS